LFLFRGIKWQAKYVKRRHPILATCIKFIPVPLPPTPLLSMMMVVVVAMMMKL
jgi:hypothetical protein